MKATAIILSASLALSPAAASAQSVTCTQIGIYTYCNTYGAPSRPGFGESFANSYLRGLNVASHYAMVNAYREAHGLPRCHYGLLGAIMSATDGRPMC